MGDVMGDMSSRRGRIQGMEADGGEQIVRAEAPLAELYDYSTGLLPSGYKRNCMSTTGVSDLNDNGTIVGYVRVDDGGIERNQPARWTRDAAGAYTLDILPHYPDATEATAVSVNNRGQVVVASLAAGWNF